MDRCFQSIDGRNRHIPSETAEDNCQSTMQDDGVGIEGVSDYFWRSVVSPRGA